MRTNTKIKFIKKKSICLQLKAFKVILYIYMFRDVAQFGSAPVLGTGGRRFESCHPDIINLKRP